MGKNISKTLIGMILTRILEAGMEPLHKNSLKCVKCFPLLETANKEEKIPAQLNL